MMITLNTLGIESSDQNYRVLQDNLIRLGEDIEVAREDLGIYSQEKDDRCIR